MAFNPRHVPWMTILGILGLGAGYGLGLLQQKPQPIIPAFWGLCIGSVAGLVLRFVLTWRWSRQQRPGRGPEPPADA